MGKWKLKCSGQVDEIEASSVGWSVKDSRLDFSSPCAIFSVLCFVLWEQSLWSNLGGGAGWEGSGAVVGRGGELMFR